MKSRRKQWKKKKKVEEHKSMLGKIIDLPLEDFERELIEQKINIGTINNLILNLEGAYNELRMRKEALLDHIFKGLLDRNDPEVKRVLDGVYAEMIKLEQKIIYLKQRSAELINVDKTPN